MIETTMYCASHICVYELTTNTDKFTGQLTNSQTTNTKNSMTNCPFNKTHQVLHPFRAQKTLIIGKRHLNHI